MHDETMQDYDFEGSIGYWICITSHLYQRQIDRELTPLGITFRQFQVLGWLVHDGELSQAKLAERMMIEPPTLVRLLDRMQAHGWIVRSSGDADRRRKIIQLGDQAKPVWDRVVECLRRTRDRATANMSADEVSTLQDLLRRVQGNLAAHSTFPFEPFALTPDSSQETNA
ncbi:MarR family winged helix-turn-helix transcriptional regulator [Stieleria varia]|uniref:Transcriptional regulator SlyA n=1 Tax=Stieleria varia TaxID=2528005 RepID=A0A5C6ANW9_9BACT|nr:MarR family transcriptional regulator [Stieleria varia]TWU01208.1 Transcriptional regulator SlyA [Stieleria varia]